MVTTGYPSYEKISTQCFAQNVNAADNDNARVRVYTQQGRLVIFALFLSINRRRRRLHTLGI